MRFVYTLSLASIFALIPLAGPGAHAGVPDPLLSEAALHDAYQEARRLRVEKQSETIIPYDSAAPVDLTADSMSHDRERNVVTASGNVLLSQSGRTLRAESVEYNVKDDIVTARGNVVMTDPTGDVYFAQDVTLHNEMKDGFVNSLRGFLIQGGRLTAQKGERINDSKTILNNASYTPCECEGSRSGSPAWQIKAKEAVYDEETHRITYKNAQFELFGVPVAWTPYLSHSDGQVKQKSGFLTPGFGYDSQLGATVTNQYYWAISPNQDATLGMMLTTKEAPVALAEYRRRFAQAEIVAEGSFTSSSRTDSVAGKNVRVDDEARGHLFAESLWNINDKWRAGLDVEVTTDEQYLRQYNFSSEDVLENELYVERFAGRNYATGRLLAFQDVRVGPDRSGDQPHIFPEMIARFTGEPNAMLGGRWDAQFSVLGLFRDGKGQDVARSSAELGWERRFASDIGLVTTLDMTVRGDVYAVNDKQPEFNAPDRDDGTVARVFPQAQITTSYPFAKPMERMQAVIEPVASLTVATDINTEDRRIPNEDSQDVQIDASNLFNASRFPGIDRVEDRSRATYGLRTGLYGYGGSYVDVFAGQSYRFDNDDNPFPAGSGLTGQQSDYVGQVAAVYDGRFGVTYRTQLASDNFASQRHEVESFAQWDRVGLYSNYLYAKALEGTDIEQVRQQVDGYATLGLTRNWSVRGGALYDLGEDEGLRRAVGGLDYYGCCMSMSLTVERNLTDDTSGDSGIDVMMRVGLKGLGDFAPVREEPRNTSIYRKTRN